MTKYFVDLIDEFGDIVDTEDEVFDNEDDAQNYAMECSNNFATGAEVLELAGRDFEDPDDYEYVVREED